MWLKKRPVLFTIGNSYQSNKHYTQDKEIMDKKSLVKKDLDEQRDDFADMLMAHDWNYERSDDNRVYQAGRKSMQAIRDFLKENTQETFKTMLRRANPFINTESII